MTDTLWTLVNLCIAGLLFVAVRYGMLQMRARRKQQEQRQHVPTVEQQQRARDEANEMVCNPSFLVHCVPFAKHWLLQSESPGVVIVDDIDDDANRVRVRFCVGR
eukprot:TRINITY_DN263_c0_g1_i1.p2 TRINITY_DN263_c0_g1~~TRINITY_DN263_c0_g1_i1.p2  ORF type:complete len:118 (+),score=36.42 TRINITY_DN263_c0_g1_i1:42-356(+)